MIPLISYYVNRKMSFADAEYAIAQQTGYVPQRSSIVLSLYPSATSSTIITTNPKAKAMVPTLECLPSAISGISSSTTT